ncbi:hypothetical protein [Bartonella quintana]|uniref:hypothetical protein n=1 Tax=Bartonella quintana TaxID=803 RepID=UPI000DA3DF7E|nr:hypothetical protein [Bartonella quintana]SQF95303.1 Uncharacterised protein [Bartonella quintana]
MRKDTFTRSSFTQKRGKTKEASPTPLSLYEIIPVSYSKNQFPAIPKIQLSFFIKIKMSLYIKVLHIRL